ncbi:MAG: enoyl-CoA hydratase/isomerase family protein [Deltaproteobacteria bacterium]|nr:enoyl-CoA hydratase/isomerase family protein [Deltaproteobacteria bacterium]
MKKRPDLDQKHDFFSTKRHENIAVLSFKENLLIRSTDLEAKAALMEYLDLVSESDSIGVVVIIGSPEKTGRDEYLEFYRQLLEWKLDRYAVLRMCHAVDQFILKIVDLNKMVVHADGGRIIPMFLNVSLACDYRIVADNTVFQNPCIELGLVPKGGGAFFLSKMLGISKASEILLSGEDNTAQEAMKLGIVDKVVPFYQLEESALKAAHDFAQTPASALWGVKRLVNYSMKDLKDYLELENEVLIRIIESPDFRQKLGEQ